MKDARYRVDWYNSETESYEEAHEASHIDDALECLEVLEVGRVVDRETGEVVGILLS